MWSYKKLLKITVIFQFTNRLVYLFTFLVIIKIIFVLSFKKSCQKFALARSGGVSVFLFYKLFQVFHWIEFGLHFIILCQELFLSVIHFL